MTLKESGEKFMGGLGCRKGNKKMLKLYYNFKNRNKQIVDFDPQSERSMVTWPHCYGSVAKQNMIVGRA